MLHVCSYYYYLSLHICFKYSYIIDAYWPSRKTLKYEIIPPLIDRDTKTTWKEAPNLLNETLRVVSDKTMNLRIKMKNGIYCSLNRKRVARKQLWLWACFLPGFHTGPETWTHSKCQWFKCGNIALKLIKDKPPLFCYCFGYKNNVKIFFDCFVLSQTNPTKQTCCKVHQELRFLLQGVGGGAKQLDCLVAAMRQDRLHVRPSSPTAVQSNNGKRDLGFSEKKKVGISFKFGESGWK